jgi:ABC-type Fe3+-hydroxamate transport system substrate-binding protein
MRDIGLPGYAQQLLLKLVICLVCSGFVLTTQAANSTKEKIEMQCGSHRVAITCGKAKADDPKDEYDERVCVHNTLSFTDSNGRTVISEDPPNVVSLGDLGNSPEMMGCGKGKDGLYYVQVMFSGCSGSTCQMHELFSEEGKRLTVNSVHLNKFMKEKSIRFSEKEWLSLP